MEKVILTTSDEMKIHLEIKKEAAKRALELLKKEITPISHARMKNELV
jgi:hypothetical protein